MSTLSPRHVLPTLAALLLAAGCWGDGNPSAPDVPGEEEMTTPPSVPNRTAGWLVQCRIDAVAQAFTCGGKGESETGEAQPVIVGGQDQYVSLDNDPVDIDGNVLSADVWVQNLLPQPLGTPDWTTPTGIRVFFHSAPTNGVTVGNADGTGTFTGTGQKYFEYARIAEALDRTVRKPWQFILPDGVTEFTFEVYVDAEVPFPNGWVEITPGSDGLAQNETMALSAQAYDLVGEPVGGRTFTWSSSDDAIVSVDPSGNITGEASGGPVTITATSDGPEADGQAAFTVGGNDISVGVAATPDAVDEGGILTYIVAVGNNGPDPISNAQVRLEVDGSTFRESSQCGYFVIPEPGNQVFVCNSGPLEDGENTAFFVDVRATAAETLVATAYLNEIDASTDLSSDLNPDNNTVETSVIVEDIPDGDLAISVADSPDPVFVDGELVYIVSVDNAGTEDASAVTVDLRVDANSEAEFTSFTPPTGCQLYNAGSFPNVDKVFRCELGSVPAGGSVDSPPLSITPGSGLIGTDLAATAEFHLVEGIYDPNTANNTAAASTSVVDGPDLVPSDLAFTPPDVFDTDNVVIEATVTNQGGVSTGSGWSWSLTVDGSPVASGSEPALAAGSATTISSGNVGPFAAGEHPVEFVIDVADAVSEKDEANNTLPGTLLVQEPGFQIELVYVDAFTPSQQNIINAAAARWESIITGDLPGEYVEFFSPSPYCPNEFEGPVDDLVVFVYTTDHASGPGGVLAFAGPWLLRSTELAVCGRMVFDINDLQGLEDTNRLEEVAGHELGHVLGIGTIWDDNPFIPNDAVDLLAGVGTSDPYFTGAQAIAQFDNAGGTGYTDNKVPVQDESGYGHWRESILDTELMTPFAEGPGVTSEWSLITAGALEDMGYQVDLGSVEIDPFTLDLPAGAAAPAPQAQETGFRDIVLKPRAIRLADGRIIVLGG